jgi:hypothetical protein
LQQTCEIQSVGTRHTGYFGGLGFIDDQSSCSGKTAEIKVIITRTVFQRKHAVRCDIDGTAIEPF